MVTGCFWTGMPGKKILATPLTTTSSLVVIPLSTSTSAPWCSPTVTGRMPVTPCSSTV